MDELREAVLEAADRADAGAAVERVYAQLQAEIERRRPMCAASGRCCRFDEYGHRLYVTTLELAAFLRGLRRRSQARTDRSLPQLTRGCPFQEGRLCGVHDIRPFGCRIFFCDASAAEWQQEQYERFHAEIRRAHDSLGIPYFYVEWREALRAVGNDAFDRFTNLPRR